MHHVDDREYFVARAASSRGLAQRATSRPIAAIHEAMAAQYDGTAALMSWDMTRPIADPQAA